MTYPSIRLLSIIILLGVRGAAAGFDVDTSPSRETHPAIAPADGSTALTNPPALIWRVDDSAATYTVEMSTSADFSTDVVRVEEIAMPFYNHSSALRTGLWHWRYFVVRRGGDVSRASPSRTFRVNPESVPLPIPRAREILANLPPHPRVFVPRGELEEFRQRRFGAGKIAWKNVQRRADELLPLKPQKPKLSPLPAKLPDHRRQVFWVEDGQAYLTENYRMADLSRDAGRANLLSMAYLISGESRYAEAARIWALFAANFRVDFHFSGLAERGQHDSVVYAYENGLKWLALTYDRLVDVLSPAERGIILDHVEFHGEAAFHWIRDVMQIHLNYQESHAQQCMHALLTTALATAGDSAKASEWFEYIVPQYASRIAWTSDDGGYFEGQSYAFKFTYILEGLVGLRTAAGIDLFKKPSVGNSGDFWLYCMSLNYWWPHWGDNLPLVNPYGNSADGYISALMASMNQDRYLQWWSDAVPADPNQIPFDYIAAGDLRPKPPVDIAQAKAFVDTGVIAAYDRFYDHGSNRIFFRSSNWGGSSHAHPDQNSFVLHAGGEIMAADVGYYTYYGDENHQHVSAATVSHNTILVDGQGQLDDLTAKGSITAFFNTPDYTFFSGDASDAYEKLLSRYRRSVLFIRPDIVLMLDELAADQPREFSWLLNTFEQPKLNASTREFTVQQRDQRLHGKYVFPDNLRFTSSNDRKYPRLTRTWTRQTEAFPEPWNSRAITERTDRTEFLTLMHLFDATSGERMSDMRSHKDETALGVAFSTNEGRENIIVRRKHDDPRPIAALDLRADAFLFAALQANDGTLKRWFAHEAREASWKGKLQLHSSAPVSAAVTFGTASARAQVSLQATQPGRVRIAISERPTAIASSAPGELLESQPVSFEWAHGEVMFEVPAGERVFWIDPAPTARALPKQISVHIRDAAGEYAVALETALAENGDWVAYGIVSPRTPGTYDIDSSRADADVLVQDRWDMERSRRGTGRLRAFVCDGSELVLRFPPAARPPVLSMHLHEVARNINLLRNGGFEAGIPNYPPRGWTVRKDYNGEYGSPGKEGWVEWSREYSATGAACLKFSRPLNRIIEWREPFAEQARDTMTATAPPVRLLKAGRYRFSFLAKGTATHARAFLQTSTEKRLPIEIVPSDTWREYHSEVELEPGFTQISIQYRAGGDDKQVLWVDDMSLSQVR